MSFTIRLRYVLLVIVVGIVIFITFKSILTKEKMSCAEIEGRCFPRSSIEKYCDFSEYVSTNEYVCRENFVCCIDKS